MYPTCSSLGGNVDCFSQVAEHVLRLVNLLKREEGTDTIHDGADISAAATHEDSDDEDSKIEEL